jgi:hypothetical protein
MPGSTWQAAESSPEAGPGNHTKDRGERITINGGQQFAIYKSQGAFPCCLPTPAGIMEIFEESRCDSKEEVYHGKAK